MLNAINIPPLSGEKAKSLVVLLHGLGDSGQGLVDLAHHWAPALPQTSFIAPNAPFPCDIVPFGYQWFSIQDLMLSSELLALQKERVLPSILKDIQSVSISLHAFLDDLEARYALPGDRIALMGFSQGAMMAFHVGPRRPSGCAGIAAFSGVLVDNGILAKEKLCCPSTLVVHGEQDSIVPSRFFTSTVEGLRQAGLPVEGHLLPGVDHEISTEGLELGEHFLASCLL